MQQVGAKSFANAQPVDPRQFPVVIPRSRTAIVRATHMWVLHKRLIQRIAGAILAVLLLAGVYQSRDVLGSVAATAYRFVQGEFAEVGFGIDSIEITGQTLTDDNDIITLLTLGAGNSTLTFDAQKAQARLEWLRAVKSATVRKVYPDRVIVSIVEKVPVARWRVGDTTWLIDEAGKKIGTDIASYTDLPLVIGEGAADDAVVMVRILDRHEALKNDLAALSRIGDRRWDLIYRNGLRVQLPESGVAQALDRLEMYEKDYALLDRDVTLIDLRVPGIVTLKPGEIAAQQLADAKKKTKHQAKGSSEYETPAEKKAEAGAQ
ncbi:MAG: FtsQ-type POTRA domain-containing protein [Devosia sp.]|uniref:cell division protein FtsQ/DivIB n=1 Tax=Devosia sp. TaxID=1871048 RepID=UPI001ACE29C2|nr:FtsQ-type POTRA domain-containing protein [Devosia sp.]MBN9316570.1 FtsQ-type POTRA domain-containing protein [Devosia sp.]